VPDDEEVVAGRGVSVLGGVDFLVGSVDAHPEDLDEDAAAILDVADPRHGKVGEVDAVGLAGQYGDRFHRRAPR
jgi:hypothetical protein